MESSRLRSLADDSTRLAEDPAKRCRSEIVGIVVSVVGMIDGVLLMTIRRWKSDDDDPTTIRQRPCPCSAQTLQSIL